MATNNIKIFDQNKANMLTDEAYNTSSQRLNGVQQGIASSQLQNKTLYQVSLVAYAIGQMMQANGLNANDADAVSTFAGNLSNTIVQKILDKASAVEAKNFTVNNKFITPQTWKAAYDFMKADSDMVNSAVDDTHYITPKLLKEGAEKYGGYTYVNNELFEFKETKRMSYIPIVFEGQEIIQIYMTPDYNKMLVSGYFNNNSGTENRYFFFIYDITNDIIIDKFTRLTEQKICIFGYDNTHVIFVNDAKTNKFDIFNFSSGKLVLETTFDSKQSGPPLLYSNLGCYYHNDTYLMFFSLEDNYYFVVYLYNKNTKVVTGYIISNNNRYRLNSYAISNLGIGVLSYVDSSASRSYAYLFREANGVLQHQSAGLLTNPVYGYLAGFDDQYTYFMERSSSSSAASVVKYDLTNFTLGSPVTVASNLSRYMGGYGTTGKGIIVVPTNNYQNIQTGGCYYIDKDLDAMIEFEFSSNYNQKDYSKELFLSAFPSNIAAIIKDYSYLFVNRNFFGIKQIDCYSGVFKKLT